MKTYEMSILEMTSIIIERMVNGVLPENYGNTDIEIETERQREFIKEYRKRIEENINKFSLDKLGSILQNILEHGGEDGSFFVDFGNKQDNNDFILDLVSEFKRQLLKLIVWNTKL